MKILESEKYQNRTLFFKYLILSLLFYYVAINNAYSIEFKFNWGNLFSNFTGEKLSITSMMANLNSTWGAIYELTIVIAKIGALTCFLIGLHKAVLVSKDKAELKSAILYFLVAACLFSLGDVTNSVSNQLGIGDAIHGNSGGLNTSGNKGWGMFDTKNNVVTDVGSQIQNSQFLNTQVAKAIQSRGGHGIVAFESLISLIRVVGLISIVRGLFILKAMGDPRQNNASVFKVALHVFAGAMLMNIVTISQTFVNTVIA